MARASHFVIFGTLWAIVLARPTEIDDLFADYLRNVTLNNPEDQSHIFKRRIYEDNQDAGSKKVSLKSIIGDLEQNFIQSAASAGVGQSQSTEQDETKPTSVEMHSILKRKTENTKAIDTIPHTEKNLHLENIATTTESIETTTDIISTMEVATTQTQLSHISVESLPALPAFEVNPKKLVSPMLKDGNSDAPQKSNQTTTNKQDGTPKEKSEKINEPVKEIKENQQKDKNIDQTKTSHDSNEVITVTTTTAPKKSVEELKESEAELKEKVAEIEADPVILSARV